MWEKTITCDVGTTKYEDRTIKCEKKVRELPNVRKKRSHVILKLHNVRMKQSNVRKEPSLVILELHNVRMELSNVRKSKGTTKCEKRIVTCDVIIAQYDDGTVKCEKKVKEPPNMRKELSHVTRIEQMRCWYCLI